MTSMVSICNRALSKIGDEITILSLEDSSKPARYCKMLYPETRDMVLRSYPWRFALKRYVLAPMAEAPVFGFAKQFALPVNCLRVWRTEENIPYQIEGKALLADADVFRFIGIQRVEDPTLFDPMFVEAFALKLASELALPLTASVSLKEALYKEYQVFVQQARTASAMEGCQDSYVQKGWLESRW
ncbi:MAG: hypothetical protein ACI4PW_05235 [Alphaproteobacteria bacterium]|jgi:hypothetical protein|nr:MAG TPA: tail tubular protein [Caudoviricetes sp.]